MGRDCSRHPDATAYLARIEARIASLADVAERGTPRDDLAAGLRTLSFERRVRIVYRVADRHLDVLRAVGATRERAPLLGA